MKKKKSVKKSAKKVVKKKDVEFGDEPDLDDREPDAADLKDLENLDDAPLDLPADPEKEEEF
jgi:hypothetical protein